MRCWCTGFSGNILPLNLFPHCSKRQTRTAENRSSENIVSNLITSELFGLWGQWWWCDHGCLLGLRPNYFHWHLYTSTDPAPPLSLLSCTTNIRGDGGKRAFTFSTYQSAINQHEFQNRKEHQFILFFCIPGQTTFPRVLFVIRTLAHFTSWPS